MNSIFIKSRSVFSLLVLCYTLSACSSTARQVEQPDDELGPYEQLEQQHPEEPLVVGPDEFRDPLEPVNRAFFKVNDVFYRYFLSPVSKGYLKVVPAPANKSISNFFMNLREPLYSINNLFQGKPGKSGKSILRLGINSTVGLLGLFDPAKAWFGLEREKTNFGQTLSHYGVGYGAYFVIPLLGPSTIRDGATMSFEYYAHPVKFALEQPDSTYLLLYEGGHTLAPTLQNYPDMVREAEDPYLFIRNLYLQRKMRDDRFEVDELFSEKDPVEGAEQSQ